MWLTNSSVGRKMVMSVTGLFLILFVTFHVLMNAVAIISPAGYDAVCAFLGANWYAVVGTLVLAAGFVIHILYAFWLTIQNRRARGNDRYCVDKRPKHVEWASQNMLVLGIIVVVFLVIHLYQFWAHMMLDELMGTEFEYNGVAVNPANGQFFLYYSFKEWWTLVVYLIGFAALWFHMTHGFWSSMQSLGANNRTWLPRLRTVSCWWATLVCLLFAVEAVVFTVRAHCDECVQAVEAALENKTVCTEAVDGCLEFQCTHNHANCPEANACVKENCNAETCNDNCEGNCNDNCDDCPSDKCQEKCPNK